MPGLSLPQDRLHIISHAGFLGKAQRVRFKLMGPNARLLHMLERLHPTLVHAHFGPDACSAMSVSDALRIPLVVTFHGYDATVTDEHLPKLYLRRRDLLKSRGAQFLCVSEFIRGRLREKGFPSDKLQVHYTGIDTEFFCPEPDLPRSPIVLFVGRLVSVKGCQYLLRAMPRVQAAVPKAKLVVIGDGPLRRELQEQARASFRDFEFLGAQDHRVVRQWMNRASVLCAPSITAESGATEGFGMVFAEAQAMGLPVVSSASGGIPEAVAHNETGLLVKERDDEALARSLLVLLQDPQLWARFSQAGRSRVERLFNIHTQARRLEDIYEQVLREHESAQNALALRPPTLDAWSRTHA
jgi:glycosyltransferase involved in cell wall biosynthesis